MNAELRSKLLGRRAVVAAVIALFTGLFFGGMVGFAAAGEPTTEMPTEFGVPERFVGDRGSYNATILERIDGGFREFHAEREAVRFQWLPARDMLDQEGEPRRVNELRHAGLNFYGGSDTGFTGLQDEGLIDLGSGDVFSFDARTGRMVAHGYRAADDQGYATTIFLGEGDGTSEIPLCGLINPLQGTNHSTKSKVAVFRDCQTPAESPANADFKAASTDQIGDRECVVYARTNWLGWVTGDDEEAYVWMCEGVPYPLRMLVEDRWVKDRFIVYRLAGWTRGVGPLSSEGPSASLDPAPDVVWAPRTTEHFSEAGLSHPFPLSAAVTWARTDPSASGLRDFLFDHPGSYLIQADYSENVRDDGIDRYWWFVYGERQEWLSIGVLRAETDGSISYRYHNRTDAAKLMIGPYDFLPAEYLPEKIPTVESVIAMWQAYKRPGGTTSSGWSFSIRPEHAWCVREATPEACTALIMLRVGRTVYHDDRFPEGEELQGGEYSILVFHVRPAETEAEVSGLSESAMNYQWARGARSTAPGAFALALDIGVWRVPTGGYAIGAGFLAIVVGFAYWSWPAVKSAVGVGLFSRVDKPRALEHPARAELATLIEEVPGIHFQEIRRRLKWSPGLARHHLSKLVQLGLVTEQATRGYTCYFPQGKLDRRLVQAIPSLKADGARRILAFVIASPGAASVDIARGTDLDPATVHYHIRRLVDAGLIVLQRDGREVRATAATFAPAALDIAA